MANKSRSARTTPEENEGPDGRAKGDAGTQAGPNEGPDGRTEDALGDFAADLGKFLGSVQNRATSWLEQRTAITEQLVQIRDTANEYLQQLGAEGARLADKFEKARRGRPPGSATRQAASKPPGSDAAPSPTVPKRTLSAEARARIAAAQKKRWAKYRRREAGK